jgi:DNA-binding IclR family transcriptional regulator
VERISGRASVPILSRAGSRLPLHATGVGKVLLAHAPEDVVDQALRQARRVTAYTVVAPALLRRQLAEVRRRGYAATAEEMSLGTRSVGVPVFEEDGQGEVLASIGIVVASGRRDPSRLVPVLAVAARGLSRAIAGAAARPDPDPGR